MGLRDWKFCPGLTLLVLPYVAIAARLAVSNNLGVGDLSKHPPFAGYGECFPPEKVDASDVVHVHCLGPEMAMKPGQALPYNLYIMLGNPYPNDSLVQVISMTSQMVNDKLEPVPLSEVYVHHYVGNPNFILGEGSEIRGSLKRAQLPEQYGYIVDGRLVQDPKYRYCNIQLINTVGVEEKDLKQCLECWCDEQGLHGSLVCCKDCPTTAHDVILPKYRLQHNVTYRRIPDEHHLKSVETIVFDITAGRLEYDIYWPARPNVSDVLTRRLVLDGSCPQDQPFEIVRCTAHQHWGGQCMELRQEDTGELLCRSCPEMGTQPGVPGDELGYVVRVVDDDLATPVLVQPGTPLILTSKYDASEIRRGVMGLMTVWVSGLTQPCTHDFQSQEPTDGVRLTDDASHSLPSSMMGAML